MLDVLIKNASVIDGTGSPAYIADIGIRAGKIVMSPNEGASECIDAAGLILCPGFIDAHSHGDQVIGQYPMMLSKISQGITTQVAGQCGGSCFPVDPERLDLLKGLISIGTYTYPEDMKNWTGFRQFAAYADATPMVLNMKTFIGHSTLRIAAMGYAERKPTKAEMDRMKAMLREGMENGAVGLSSGLIYPPGSYADTDELVELASVVKDYGGIYASHIRGESDGVVDSVREALDIGRRAGVPVCISHHKICGKQNWGKSKDTLALVHKAVEDGVCVTIDQYPYTANSTYLNAVIPPKYFVNDGVKGMVRLLADPRMRSAIKEDILNERDYENFYFNCGGFDSIQVSGCEKTPEADGLLISEIAERTGRDPFDAFFDLLAENDGRVNAVYHCIGEEDNCRIILDENTCVGTDGTCRTLNEQTHPRTFGAFPRAIRRYVKELGLMPLETMIRKMTGFPAERLKLYDRGTIAEGKAADLVLFDYNTIKDAADYRHSTRLSEGIRAVYVNGKLAYDGKKVVTPDAGRLLRHNGNAAGR